MRRLKFSFRILILFALSISAIVNRACGEDVVYQTRAVWVAASEYVTPEKADATVARALAANLNVLLPQVYCHTGAYFISSYVEMQPGIPEGHDPLGYLIEKAHAAGLEVHPWFCIAIIAHPDRISVLREHPEFGARAPGNADWEYFGGEVFANIHNPGYRDFIVAFMLDCVRNYDVDGLHLDYIRSGTTSFDPESEKEFFRKFGKPLSEASIDELHAWHAPAVEDIVIRASRGAHEIKPRAITSAAVFPQISYIWPQGQDSRKWANNGWIDLIFTMDYEISPEMVRFYEMGFVKHVPAATHGAGLAVYLETPGQPITSRTPELVMDQMKVLRKYNIKHIAFFRDIFMSDEINAALKAGPFKSKAIPYFRKPAGK